jgi:hypothetical protein
MDQKNLNSRKEPRPFYDWMITVLQRFAKYTPSQRDHVIRRLRSESLREKEKRRCLTDPRLDCPFYNPVGPFRRACREGKSKTKGKR